MWAKMKRISCCCWQCWRHPCTCEIKDIHDNKTSVNLLSDRCTQKRRMASRVWDHWGSAEGPVWSAFQALPRACGMPLVASTTNVILYSWWIFQLLQISHCCLYVLVQNCLQLPTSVRSIRLCHVHMKWDKQLMHTWMSSEWNDDFACLFYAKMAA